MADLRAGDAGVLISVTLDENISDATLLELTLESPVGSTSTVAAVLASASVVEYTTTSATFSRAGRWAAQVHVVQPGRDRRSSIFFLSVDRAL